MNRRRHVTHLQALSVAARRSGFWRVGDRFIPFDGSIGRIESCRLVVFDNGRYSPSPEPLTVQKVKDIVAEMRRMPQAPTVMVDGVECYVIAPPFGGSPTALRMLARNFVRDT